ncbi:MAG: FAD/NAD(P)-binding protein [Rhodospirillales bacterium]|nr:FAD/NAD(P)-binding protein [Rhodospirillales bacterium]
MTGTARSIAIVGAGFSGTLLAVQMLRRCRPDDCIYLIERRAGFGRGLAYSTLNENHLLNVRAGNMSAFFDQPDHFVTWLAKRANERGQPLPSADTFVSRRLYGTYIRSLLSDELWRNGHGRNLFLVPDQVIAINEEADAVMLTVAGGQCYRLDQVVLAAGNLVGGRCEGPYFGDAWRAEAVRGVPRHGEVLLIGTGLTMIDTVLSLLDAGHEGRLHAISRRGLLPRRHAPSRPLVFSADEMPKTTSVARITRWLRRYVAAAKLDGRDWRDVFDGLRPHTLDMWRTLPMNERQRFLRHLRPWWEVYRHRMAPAVGGRIDEAIARGQLVVSIGRIDNITLDERVANVAIRRRDVDTVEHRTFARVINCTGLHVDFQNCDDPLIRDLLARNLARPDALSLGLEVNEKGALLNGGGRPSPRLFAVGPITRGTFWEIVAVPDIRVHCARLASYLMGSAQEVAPVGITPRQRRWQRSMRAQHRLLG